MVVLSIVNEVRMNFGGPIIRYSNHARKVLIRWLPVEQEVLSIAQSQGKGREPGIIGEDW